MGYYTFKPEDAYSFGTSLHAIVKRKGDELVFKHCPYCHGTGQGNEESFSINLINGVHKCLRDSCLVSGNMVTLAKDFPEFKLSSDVSEYYGLDRDVTKYRTFNLKHIESKDAAVRYCQSRGISENICRKYELTVQKEHENVLVFPFRNENGVVDFIKYRKTDFDKTKDNAKEWCEKNGRAILFGMNQCDMAVTTLVITEGQMDSLSVAEAGIPNAVSVPTGARGQSWIPHCWDWLTRFKEMVIFGDCEKGHITLVDMLKNRFPGLVKVVQEEDYQGCKDANEILQTYGSEAVKKAVENAKPLPIASIRSMATVDRVNILDMDAFRTGIAKLDEVLTKGIYFSQVVLLTGARGDGKSTWMNQVICNAIDQNVKTFLYSGELPNHVVRNFTDTMLAGCHENDLRNETAEKIANWYKDKLYVFDSNAIENDELSDLMGIVEKAITQYGCRLICLDNLMTIVEAQSNDSLYRVQSQFVGKLAHLAKQYNVAFILVAHPRKKSSMDNSDFSSDEVSGSADITNKVDVVISYQRPKTKKDEQIDNSKRELWVSKNRLTGKLALGKNAIPVKYEPGSRRIVGEEQNFSRKYGWEDNPTPIGFEAVNTFDGIEVPF